MDNVKGEFFLSIVKGLVHRLGNIANGIGINVQILNSKKDVLGDDFKFLERIEQNSVKLNSVLSFISQVFVKQMSELSEKNKELIKDFVKSQYPLKKNSSIFQINWDSIQSSQYYILLPILFSAIGDLESEVSIYEQEEKLIFQFSSDTKETENVLLKNLLENMKIKYIEQGFAVIVEDLC